MTATATPRQTVTSKSFLAAAREQEAVAKRLQATVERLEAASMPSKVHLAQGGPIWGAAQTALRDALKVQSDVMTPGKPAHRSLDELRRVTKFLATMEEVLSEDLPDA